MINLIILFEITFDAFIRENMFFLYHLYDLISKNDMRYRNKFNFFLISGILGSFATNNKDISLQLMNKFLQISATDDIQLEEYAEEVEDTLQCGGSLRETMHSTELTLSYIMTSRSNTFVEPAKQHEQLLKPIKTRVLVGAELTCIENMVSSIASDESQVMHFASVSKRADVGNLTLQRDDIVYAKWYGGQVIKPDAEYRPAVIEELLELVVIIGGERKTWLIANVTWLKQHPDRNYFWEPVEVWDIYYEPNGLCDYIPVSRVSCKASLAKYKYNFAGRHETVNIVTPMSTLHSSLF